MPGIKNIATDVPVIDSIPEGKEASVYVECGGEFKRAKGAQAREAIGLGGIVITDEGLFCVEVEDEE